MPWKVRGKRSLLPHILNISTIDRWLVSYVTSPHNHGKWEGKNSCYARNWGLIALSVSHSAHNLVTILTELSQYTSQRNLCTLHYKLLNMCITKVKLCNTHDQFVTSYYAVMLMSNNINVKAPLSYKLWPDLPAVSQLHTIVHWRQFPVAFQNVTSNTSHIIFWYNFTARIKILLQIKHRPTV